MTQPINHITELDVLEFKNHDSNTDCMFFNTLREYERIATQNAQYPGKGSAFGLVYIALAAAGEAGELAGHVKKAMRDDGLIVTGNNYQSEFPHEAVCLVQPLTLERRAKIIHEAGGVLWYLAALAGELNMSLSEIALANLEQLADRTERGTLSGGGDDR